MKFINFLTGALVATTATNFLLASDVHAGFPPNGWTQVGQSCSKPGMKDGGSRDTYYKLAKTGTTQYGVYNGTESKWVKDYKGVTKKEANRKMNSSCNVSSYQPT